jgi:hypothetical protein
MRNEKEIAQHYLRTNILGAYETTDVIWQSDSEGTRHRTFDDSFVYSDDTHHTIERDMEVEGRIFRIRSVFPISNTSTPTKKMLAIIGNDCEKELKNA